MTEPQQPPPADDQGHPHDPEQPQGTTAPRLPLEELAKRVEELAAQIRAHLDRGGRG